MEAHDGRLDSFGKRGVKVSCVDDGANRRVRFLPLDAQARHTAELLSSRRCERWAHPLELENSAAILLQNGELARILPERGIENELRTVFALELDHDRILAHESLGDVAEGPSVARLIIGRDRQQFYFREIGARPGHGGVAADERGQLKLRASRAISAASRSASAAPTSSARTGATVSASDGRIDPAARAPRVGRG